MPPRAIWSGTITFGLIAMPVKLYTAVGRENDDKVEFHLLHEKDNARIHNERRCAKGHKVEWDDLVRGHEYQKGKWVTFTDEELGALDVDSLHTVDVVEFVPAEQIDPIYIDSTYYVYRIPPERRRTSSSWMPSRVRVSWALRRWRSASASTSR